MMKTTLQLPYGDYIYQNRTCARKLPVLPVMCRYGRTCAPIPVASPETWACVFFLRGGEDVGVQTEHAPRLCRAGGCLLIPAGRPAILTPQGALEYLLVELTLKAETGDTAVWIPRCPAALDRAVRLLDQIASGSFADPYDASLAAYALWVELLRSQNTPQRDLPPAVRQAIALYRSRYPHLMGASDAADLLGISRAHFCRMFTKSVGITPGKYLRTIRIENARRMLACTDDSVELIAHATGFEGANYFCRVFKAETGETPGQYRRRSALCGIGTQAQDIAL